MAIASFCSTCNRTVYLGDQAHSVCPVCSSPLVGANRPLEYVPDAAATRIADNENLFRDVNERIRAVADHSGPDDDKVGFVCECGQRQCTEVVHLSLGQYETVRANPWRFVVVPGHEVPGIETVVEESAHYGVVEKVGPARGIVEERDPRA